MLCTVVDCSVKCNISMHCVVLYAPSASLFVQKVIIFIYMSRVSSQIGLCLNE